MLINPCNMKSDCATLRVLICIVFVFFSCEKKKSIYPISLKKNGILELPLESYVNPVKSSVVSYESQSGNQKIGFFILKDSDQEIQLFNLQTKALETKIPILRSGPNKFMQVDGFQILSDKEILFNTSTSATFLISDYDLQNLKSYDYSINGNNDLTIKPTFTAQIYKQDYVNQDSLVFITQTHDLFDYSNIKDFKIALKCNLNTHKASFLELNYPNEDYLENKLVPFVGQTFNGKEIIYSFAASNQILKYDPLTNKSEYIELTASDYLKTFISLKGTEDSFENFSYAFAANSHNLSFVYDKYEEVYYRFFYPGIDININDDKLVYYSENFKYFTITVFDKEFNKMYELPLPYDTYDPSSFFINSDGLFLGYSEENLNYDEDFLKFDKFNLINED